MFALENKLKKKKTELSKYEDGRKQSISHKNTEREGCGGQPCDFTNALYHESCSVSYTVEKGRSQNKDKESH